MMRKYFLTFIAVLVALILISGCGNKSVSSDVIPQKTGSMELDYATEFSVDYYDNGYCHISIMDGNEYVLVPEKMQENSLGFENVTYIHMPCQNIYLAASSVMDFFSRLDMLDNISACSTTADDYTIEEAKQRIQNGDICYVGKYNMPDYELVIEKECTLAIESTMIYHSPKTKEQLENLGVPVLIERSSYEKTPLGRLEWIKLYGLLCGKQEQAETFFNQQKDIYEEIALKQGADETNRKSVAFFYVSSSGYINVRRPGDYISQLIDTAGGEYCLMSLAGEDESALSTLNIQWEDFYLYAQNADILIYNGTIDGGINSISDLLDKKSMFSDFKAVKEGNVYCTNLNMYQQTSDMVGILSDFYSVISLDDTQNLNYLRKIEG